ncbi:single-stranded DNA-binding protein [Phyllobacterium sp. 628]|uniref:single-stranded DNA-binding protein n=1 Tax=Phyllobacterium sp. 628 TaxID=2718938 RepID=UPI00166253B8|nr:single-stranded DNA-binding protein [Phyllobacterium sp. 628]QND53440.1 single-stranded DNA-binding protein [Phyllobacterium sp. 628]
MAGSLNKVQLIGNLGDDPEIHTFDNGSKVANFSIATSESWKDKASGEKKERTEWHRIVVWNEGLISVISQYVEKGDKVYVEGELQTRKWQDKDGNDRYSTEVVLTGFSAKLLMVSGNGGGRASDQNGNADRPGNKAPSGDGGGTSGGRSFSRDLDDEIPFAPEWR